MDSHTGTLVNALSSSRRLVGLAAGWGLMKASIPRQGDDSDDCDGPESGPPAEVLPEEGPEWDAEDVRCGEPGDIMKIAGTGRPRRRD